MLTYANESVRLINIKYVFQKCFMGFLDYNTIKSVVCFVAGPTNGRIPNLINNWWRGIKVICTFGIYCSILVSCYHPKRLSNS